MDRSDVMSCIENTRQSIDCLKKKIDEYGCEVSNLEQLLKGRMKLKTEYDDVKKEACGEHEDAIWTLKQEVEKNKVQLDELRAKYNEINITLEQKMKSTTELEQDVQKTRELLKETQAESCAQEREADEIRKEMNLVRKEKQSLEKHMEKMKEEYFSAQRCLERCKKNRLDLQQEINTLKCVTERKQKEYEIQFCREKERCDCLHSKLQQMECKVDECQGKLERMRQVDRDNDRMIEMKREELQRLESDIRTHEAEECFAKEQIALLSQQLESPRRELNCYKERIAALKAEICQLDVKNAGLRKILDSYLVDLQSIKDCSGSKINQEKSQSHAIAMELEQFALRLGCLDDEIVEKREILQQKISRVRVETSRLRCLQSEFSVVKAECDLVKNQQKAAIEERTKAEENLHALQENQDCMKKKICEFQKELCQLEQESENYERNYSKNQEQMERKLTEEKLKTQELVQQYEKLKSELESVYAEGNACRDNSPRLRMALQASKDLIYSMENRLGDLSSQLNCKC